MKPRIRPLRDGDEGRWDAFVRSRPEGCAFHAAAWRHAVGEGYGLEAHFLMAEDPGDGEVAGVLPLVQLRHWLLGRRLVSLPYVDAAGVLARDEEAALELVSAAVQLADRLGASRLELRQHVPLAFPGQGQPWRAGPHPWLADCQGAAGKVRMVLALPDSALALMASFKAKLRSQIRRPQAAGLVLQEGGEALLDEFYAVHAENMRDLGSPVHSAAFLRAVVRAFGARARVFLVRDAAGRALAGSITLGEGGLMCNPWSSTLPRARPLSANMLLYWGMLESACHQGYRAFDFGRSTRGGGTHRFKQQWGASEQALIWYGLARDPPAAAAAAAGTGGRRALAAACWRRLPTPVTRLLGPALRRHISL